MSWFKNPDIIEFLEIKHTILTKELAVENISTGMQSGTYLMCAIVLLATNSHIGNLKIGPIDRIHNVSDLVCIISDRSQLGKGLAEEAIRLGGNMAFDVYGIRKLSGAIYAGNVGSIKAYIIPEQDG